MSELPRSISLIGLARDSNYKSATTKALLQEEQHDAHVIALRTMYTQEIPAFFKTAGTGMLHRWRAGTIRRNFLRRIEARGSIRRMDWPDVLWSALWIIMALFIPLASSVLFFQIPAYEAVARQMTVYPRIVFGRLMFALGYSHPTAEIFRLIFELQLLSGLPSALTYLPLINVPGGRALYGDALTRWPVIGGTAFFMLLVTTRTGLFHLLLAMVTPRRYSDEIRRNAISIRERHQRHRAGHEALLKRHEEHPVQKAKNRFWYGPFRISDWAANQNSGFRIDLREMDYQLSFITDDVVPTSFSDRTKHVTRAIKRAIKRVTLVEWIILAFTVVVTLFVVLPFYKSAIVIATAGTWGGRIIILMTVAVFEGKTISELVEISSRTVSVAIADLPLIICLLATKFEGLDKLSNLIPLSILVTFATLTITDCILPGILWGLVSLGWIKEDGAAAQPAGEEEGVELRG